MFAPIDGAATTTNLWGVRWSKLCVNGMRNGVSAATGMGGNERDGHPKIRPVVIRLADTQYQLAQVPQMYVRRATLINDAGALTAAGRFSGLRAGRMPWLGQKISRCSTNVRRPSLSR